MKLGAFLEKLAKKAGVDTASDEFKAVLAFAEELPDEIANKIDRSLLTVDAAKNNSDVNKALRQSILGVADTRMDELITELGLQPGEDFVNNKNTYEKIPMLVKLALDEGRKKSDLDGHKTVQEQLKKQRDEFTAKEADYQKKLKDSTDSLTAKEKEFLSNRENDKIIYELQKKLFGKDYVFPKEMDSDLKVSTALGAVNNELAKKGLKIKRDENGQLAIFDKEDKPAYSDTHEPLKLDPYIDGVLAQNKLLKINDGSQNQQNNNGASGGNNFVPGSTNKGNAAILAELDQQLAEMK